MLSDKIAYLLKRLEVENSVIAGYAGCTPANFSRMRSGKRSYSINSITVKKFTEGVYNYCSDSGKLEELCSVISLRDADEKTIVNTLLNWLFDENSPDAPETNDESGAIFGKKLCVLMDIADISNIKLSTSLRIDPSYVSRMRSGDKMPKRSAGLMMRLCTVLADRITERKKQHELEELTGMRPDNSSLAERIYVWLYDRGVPANVQAVRDFIEKMGSMNGDITCGDVKLPPIDESGFYIGNEGLHNAAVRFLKSVIDNRSREIWLYSDNSIDWMTGDFRNLWTAMMRACLKNGTRVRVIHSLDRNANDMLQAINLWMPLYMTGLVEAYYSTGPQGGRFTYTLFVAPGDVCVQSYCVRELSAEAEYNYLTDEKSIGKCERGFGALLSKCRPLLNVVHDVVLSDDADTYEIGNVIMSFDGQHVTVQSKNMPTAAFVFSYPPLYRAFRSFADTIGE